MYEWFEHKIKEAQSKEIYMLLVPRRVVKRETLGSEFNDGFFKEMANLVSKEHRKAYFYEDEKDAHNARFLEHTMAGVFKIEIPKTAIQGPSDPKSGEIKVDVSAITPESIKTVTVQNVPTLISYIIPNPLVEPDAPVTKIDTPRPSLTQAKMGMSSNK
jgi:hypothetical protein